MGADRFRTLIEDDLRTCPFRSFTLRHPGERLPEFTKTWESATEIERVWFHLIA